MQISPVSLFYNWLSSEVFLSVQTDKPAGLKCVLFILHHYVKVYPIAFKNTFLKFFVSTLAPRNKKSQQKLGRCVSCK